MRREMNEAGGVELLDAGDPAGRAVEESGRWQKYGKELLRIKDRHERDFCFGPTHEEVITDLVRARRASSYRQLPFNLYQIQTKFRDEIRPRFGLMRGREFLMKDAYSFHASAREPGRGLRRDVRAPTARIFEACGLDYTVVEADTGTIGGSSSHEFMVLAATGESAVVQLPRLRLRAPTSRRRRRRARSPRPRPPAAPPTRRRCARSRRPGCAPIDEVARAARRRAERSS